MYGVNTVIISREEYDNREKQIKQLLNTIKTLEKANEDLANLQIKEKGLKKMSFVIS